MEQKIRSFLLPNGLSTSEILHILQRKQSSCQCFSLYDRSWILSLSSISVDRWFLILSWQWIALCVTRQKISNYLRINTNWFGAFVAAISEDVFIAFDAIWMFIPENIPLTGESIITLPAAKVITVPVFIHRLCVFTGKY